MFRAGSAFPCTVVDTDDAAGKRRLSSGEPIMPYEDGLIVSYAAKRRQGSAKPALSREIYLIPTPTYLRNQSDF